MSIDRVSARLVIETSADVLRAVKLRATQEGKTVRAYVLGLLAADGVAAAGEDPERKEWSSATLNHVFARDGGACRYCGSLDNPTFDHVAPRCQGGGDEAENLVVACRSCNSRKGGRTPEQAGMALLVQENR